MKRVLLGLCIACGLVCAPLGRTVSASGGETSLVAPGPAYAELKGEIKSVDFNSENCGGIRNVKVYLPPDHDPKMSYPVVYAADGLANVQFDLVEPLIASGKIPPIIIVGMMYGPGMRQREYIPQMNPKDFDAHEKFVVEEVIPWAEKEFGASKDRKERVVYGSSNSGPFALTMASRHPKVFGNVFAMMVYGLPFPAWEEELKEQEKDPTRFILVAGSQDAHGVQSNQKVEQILKEKKFPVKSYVIKGEGHTHELNRKMFPVMLEETFGFRLFSVETKKDESEEKEAEKK